MTSIKHLNPAKEEVVLVLRKNPRWVCRGRKTPLEFRRGKRA